MRTLFGTINQVAYVVRDIDAAMNEWVRAGVGPWFYTPQLSGVNWRYRGVDSPIEMAFALAYSGPVQVELIQPLNNAPSVYNDFIDSGRAGVQHIGFFADNYEAVHDRALSAGYRVEQDGAVPGQPARRCCYFGAAIEGTMLEIIDTGGSFAQANLMMREAAENWDGSDPIRLRGR